MEQFEARNRMMVENHIEAVKAHFEVRDYLAIFLIILLALNIVLAILFYSQIIPAYFFEDVHYYHLDLTIGFKLWTVVEVLLVSLGSIYAWKYPRGSNFWFVIAVLLTIIPSIIWAVFLLFPIYSHWYYPVPS
jgi:hypothetical protein